MEPRSDRSSRTDGTIARRRKFDAAFVVPRPGTSRPAPAHQVHPYLLKGLAIERANQVWAADNASIPMARGFLYLVAVMDWARRAVLARRLSITPDVGVLRRGSGGSAGASWPAADLQRRPGGAAHRGSFTGRLKPAGARQHGRPRPLARRPVGRAVVALAAARGGAPQGLWRRARGACRDRGLEQPPHRAPAAPAAGSMKR